MEKENVSFFTRLVILSLPSKTSLALFNSAGINDWVFSSITGSGGWVVANQTTRNECQELATMIASLLSPVGTNNIF